MNRFRCRIASVEENAGFRLITLNTDSKELLSITLELPEEFHPGKVVDAVFKETETALSLNSEAVTSIENVLLCRVQDIRKGKLLSQVYLDSSCGKLTAVITSRSLDFLGLMIGHKICALVKAADISLSEAGDD